jgi:hypothetical protein
MTRINLTLSTKNPVGREDINPDEADSVPADFNPDEGEPIGVGGGNPPRPTNFVDAIGSIFTSPASCSRHPGIFFRLGV